MAEERGAREGAPEQPGGRAESRGGVAVTWQHVRLVEERIYNELEAEAVDYAMESRAQITLLMEKLFASEKLLQSLSLNNLSHSIMSSH